MYIIVFFITFVLLLITGLDVFSALSAAFSGINNLGPGFGQVGQNYANISNTAKYILSAVMVMGRLELLSVIALFNSLFWR